MAPDERSRVEASQALTEQLGPAAAAALMECIPPFGWHEIATKDDLRQLEEKLGRRFESLALDARFEALREGMRAEFTKQTNRILMWTVGTIVVGMGSAIGAIIAVGS